MIYNIHIYPLSSLGNPSSMGPSNKELQYFPARVAGFLEFLTLEGLLKKIPISSHYPPDIPRPESRFFTNNAPAGTMENLVVF